MHYSTKDYFFFSSAFMNTRSYIIHLIFKIDKNYID